MTYDRTESMTCIICPIGCELSVTATESDISVVGNQCPRGETYATTEMTDPRRTLASTILVTGGDRPLASIRVDDVPKERIADVMDVIRKIVVEAPAEIGDVVGELKVEGKDGPVELRIIVTVNVRSNSS